MDDFDVGPASRRGGLERLGGRDRLNRQVRRSRRVRGAFAKRGGESGVGFDGDDAAGARREKLRHFAVARADFDPDGVAFDRKRVGDTRAPGNIREKMLTEFLARLRM